MPVPPPAPRRGNVALGVVAAVVAAVVTAAVHGTVIGKTEYEIGYAAIGVGLLIGFAVFASDETGIPVMTALTEHLGLLTDVWKEEADVMTYLFLAIGAAAAFSGAKKAAG